ncbi:protoporphyrinogen oxidase HemJ [Parvularcula dongshanensis]|uniref:Protoporphyrinogen IX oxidase n=1 Tax=Parvularcula dongshanensis TaxID=1173995 RepID=A0A840I110_9PROT|nr:protoporphyrinogen oxidase HemJ [Parvularcula dongshanensis]MBB4658035.1 putative membrane protein [Parvularcula dongshanensis]
MLYLTVKALHVLSLIAWMAAMLYLPRLFIYHMQAAPGGEAEGTFAVMERRLLKGIMTPAMIATWVFALVLLALPEGRGWLNDGWLHAKILLVILMSGLHGFYAASRKKFERGERPRTERFWRLINEAPFVLLIGIVFLVILKPWMN